MGREPRAKSHIVQTRRYSIKVDSAAKAEIRDLEYKKCASQHAVQPSLDSCKPHSHPLHGRNFPRPPYNMDRYPCVNRYKHGVDCPGWVNVHGARCEDCVVYNR
ncbi:hypothetical protein CGMCC3_g14002 [Colletotrichum fructicola]|nr:uncharacterized protein CGMCC3_g14002 [Colletotrichum fructicola]KAE9569870.1 hypothetical protein CGMCC3_g14002 [Colletotrichum fructicola]